MIRFTGLSESWYKEVGIAFICTRQMDTAFTRKLLIESNMVLKTLFFYTNEKLCNLNILF